MKPDYDTTIARMAGNIASGYCANPDFGHESSEKIAEWSVDVARAIVAEVKRTQPGRASEGEPS